MLQPEISERAGRQTRLKMSVEGCNYKTAALELNVGINMISFHMRRIYKKLQLPSKSKAVAKALLDRPVN